MKAIAELNSTNNTPKLIPTFKQTERKLLSVFMSVLEMIPEFRGAFLSRCGFNSGKTSYYESYMEPSYRSSKYESVRPDGLIFCRRGENYWTAFIEAKSEKSSIRSDQIQDYILLASQLDVQNIISISNDFANSPTELPYHIPNSKRKNTHIVHFAWAELRTFMELFLYETTKLSEVERQLIQQCLEYFWHKDSGISTYDAMPEDWPNFVESAATNLGFNTKTPHVTDIVHGWQQECRDLCSKIMHAYKGNVEFVHPAGRKSTQDERLKFDRKSLAEEYYLEANYKFKATKSNLEITVDLKSCRTSVEIEIETPKDKKAKASVNWIYNLLLETGLEESKIIFDWKGRNGSSIHQLSELKDEIDTICENQKDAPKKIRIIQDIHNVRRFKSRKRFVEDLETLVLNSLNIGVKCKII